MNCTICRIISLYAQNKLKKEKFQNRYNNTYPLVSSSIRFANFPYI